MPKNQVCEELHLTHFSHNLLVLKYIASLLVFTYIIHFLSFGQKTNELRGDPLFDPIPESIETGSLLLTLQDFATIPPSSSGNTVARINYLSHANDSSDRLFVNDLRNDLYLIDSGVVSIYLNLKDRFPNFVDAPGLGSGFGFFAFHPEFKSNGKFYTVHTELAGSKEPDFRTTLTEQVQGVIGEWTTSNPLSNEFEGSYREILRIGFGAFLHGFQQIGFNPTAAQGDSDYGMLYLAIGDGNVNPIFTEAPQQLHQAEGKIFRIDPSGTNSKNGQYGIPIDNPFSDQDSVLGEIWAYGFRNPHRFSWDSQTHKMYVANIGERNIDAIYEVGAGDNSGWNEREGAFLFKKDDPDNVFSLPPDDSTFGYNYPVAQYDHDEGRAVVGGFVYRGTIVPDLNGKYLFGDIVEGHIFYTNVKDMKKGIPSTLIRKARLFDNAGIERSFTYFAGRNRADLRFGKDADGEIYLLSKANGKIWKIVPKEAPSKPNLICGDLGTLTISGSEISISKFQVKNSGSAVAGISVVGYYLSEDKNITRDDLRIGEKSVDTIGVNKIVELTFSINISGVVNGSYFLGAIVDDKGTVLETSGEDNFCFYNAPKINVNNSSSENKANLVCGDLGTLTVLGEQISISGFQVFNSGTVKATASTIGYYLSLDSSITRNDIRIGEDTVGIIEPNLTRTKSFSTTLLNIPAGEYFLGIVVDDLGTVYETSGEDNFCYFNSPKILIGGLDTVGKANLVCGDLGTLAIDGNQITISDFQVLNNGNSEAPASTVGYYLSLDNKINQDDLRFGESPVRNLAPNQKTNLSFSDTLGKVPVGEYFLGMILNDKESFIETSREDNICYFNTPKIAIPLNTGELANLECGEFGKVFIQEDTLSIEGFQVKNTGVIPVQRSRIGLYLSHDINITKDDIQLGEYEIGPLDPTEIKKLNFSADISTLPEGSYFLGSILDDEGIVLESKEEDNICFFPSAINILLENCTIQADVIVEDFAFCNNANGKARIEGNRTVEDLSVIWDNGEIGLVADSLAYGTHSVSIEDTNGCSVNRIFFLPRDSLKILPDLSFDVSQTDSTVIINNTSSFYDSIHWVINGHKINVLNPILDKTSNGPLIEITLYGFNTCGEARLAKTVTIEISNSLPVNNPSILEDKKQIRIYPNPTRGIFFIEGLSGQYRPEIAIYNMMGSLISQQSYILNAQKLEIDLTKSLPQIGIYMVIVKDPSLKLLYTERIQVIP